MQRKNNPLRPSSLLSKSGSLIWSPISLSMSSYPDTGIAKRNTADAIKGETIAEQKGNDFVILSGNRLKIETISGEYKLDCFV